MAVSIEFMKEFSQSLLNHKKARTEFYALQKSLADTPAQADATIALISQVLTWCEDKGHVDINRAFNMTRLTRKGTRAAIRFYPRHHQLVEQHADPDLARLYNFSLLTAIRAGDARKLKWSQLDIFGFLVFKPSKTRKRPDPPIVHLPVFMIRELMLAMGPIPENRDQYIFTYNGEQWNARTLKQKWLDFRLKYMPSEVKLTHWHDLRGTGAQLLLDARCSTYETGSVTGHKITSPDEKSALDNYTTRSRVGAQDAFLKLRVAIDEGCLTDEFWFLRRFSDGKPFVWAVA